MVFNKTDIPEVMERWPEVQKQLEARGFSAMPISAATSTNITPVLWKLYEMLQNVPEPEVVESLPIYTPEQDPRAFTISHDQDGDWVVHGIAIERAAKMTFWEHSGSVRRFQNLLKTLGIEDALRKAGVENGDTVMIGDDFELEWVD